ncbi:bifunctional 2-polyprenyl-6-hydroxyphenol methylase/3-demethylubiquinol 3-O-methyltransferase UbiG [Bacillus sp. AFS017336]|uniref:class I SAM-dependent methyltransferase n=1 Tax=Bacillus sp. AFS017336 TaxID=2033489 RepID=UPI000BF1BDDA|nr:class I SAM-dependent methyltransferase [Bacillus sp. AFS017336]PEK98896.1 SAM-dependent methyltransferase [Bacillus sp. AFS017336]
MSKIISYYNQFDEWGRLEREPIEFQVNCNFIKKYLPKTGCILDNGAGPGKYSMKLAKDGYRVTLTDLTPRLVEIAKNKALEFQLDGQFDGFYAADARELGLFSDEQFDASLMLGPMYHLQDEKDRIQAVKELNRVTKKNGLVFVAFMPRIRHVFSSLLSPNNWRPNDNMNTILEFSQSGSFNHADDGRFTGAYYFNIEDINPFMEQQGFETLELIGSNVGTILNDESWNYWRNKGESEVEKVISLLIEKATDPYILGTSSHLLYIGKKK